MVDLREGVKFRVSDYVSIGGGEVEFHCGETYTVESVRSSGGTSYIVYDSEGYVGQVFKAGLVWSNFYDCAYEIVPETKNDYPVSEGVSGMFGVKFEELRKGDVVNVVWCPRGPNKGVSQLYLDQVIEEVHGDFVFSGGGSLGFNKDVCTFFLVDRTELPAELGSLVEHEDGWKFIRVGEDQWVGWCGTGSCVYTDADVSDEKWTVSSLGQGEGVVK